MKKLLLFVSLVTTTVAALSQGQPYPNYQPQGNSVTRWSQQGAVQGIKGIINGIYPDTATANIGYIDYYPGAQIFTTNDKFIWVRDFPAVRWIRQSPTITSFTFNTDSSIVVCYGNGVCDTLSMFNFTTVVNNIVQNFNDSTIYNINDSTIVICNLAGSCDTIDLGTTNIYNIYTDSLGNQFVVTCDTLQVICVSGTSVGDSCYQQQLCDTIPIEHLSAPFYQNLLRVLPGTTVREHGSAQGDLRGQMIHDTWAYLGYNKLTFEGYSIERPMVTFDQQQWNQFSSSILSLNHYGTYPPDGRIDSVNRVNLYFNYFNKFVFDTTGFMHDRIGYPIITNARGSRYSLGIDNANSKQTGVMLHTLDTAYTDAVTIFGNQTPNQYAFSVSPFPTTTLLDSRIAVFKTDKTVQIPGYPDTRDDGITSKALFTDADGNMKLGTITGAGDIITIINDTTINICSFGTNLCDTITINNIGVIQTVFVLNDSTLVVCDSVGVCDTLIISSTSFSQPITARNGLIMATPTEVQLGQGIGAPGNPAILLSNREIPMGGFYLSLNASATQASNIFQTKNAAAAIRARITSAASFSNTGGQTGAEIFGDLATVSGVNGVVFGNSSTAAANGIAIGTNVNSGSTNILISNVVSTNISAFSASVAVGGTITGNNGTSVGASSSAGPAAVAIGTSALASASGATAVGGNTIASGGNSLALNGQATFTESIGIQGNTTAANQMVIGKETAPIIDGYMGDGSTSGTPNDFTLNSTGGFGTNIGGADFTLAGGKGSGNATPGVVNIATSVIGASGTTLQTLANRAIVSDKSFNINATRFEEYKGANVVAANDVTLGIDGNLFTITGSTQINAITTANWQAGSTIGFIFTGAPLVKHNTAGGAGTATMLLAGSADFQAAAGDNIEFRYDGTNWHEIGRTLAASGSGATMTADNGLTKNTATNMQLGSTTNSGSPLLHDTYINTTGSYILYVRGSNTSNLASSLYAWNTAGGTAVYAVNDGGSSLPPLRVENLSGVNNSVISLVEVINSGDGFAGANGIGGSITFKSRTTTLGGNNAGSASNTIVAKWTDATTATRTSQLYITGVTGGTIQTWFTIGQSGYVQFRPMTVTEAGAIATAEGLMVFVSNTDATFTSVGLWIYQNGAWKAL